MALAEGIPSTAFSVPAKIHLQQHPGSECWKGTHLPGTASCVPIHMEASPAGSLTLTRHS